MAGSVLPTTVRKRLPYPAMRNSLSVRRRIWDLTLVLEPGRVIVGNAGTLVTRVTFIKNQGTKRFIIVDAGMNDLIRPALYGSHHQVWSVAENIPLRSRILSVRSANPRTFIAKNRELPDIPARRSRGRYERRRLWILLVFELQLETACA